MDVRVIHPGGKYIVYARNLRPGDSDVLGESFDKMGVEAMIIEPLGVEITIYEVK